MGDPFMISFEYVSNGVKLAQRILKLHTITESFHLSGKRGRG
jgi:hypothetical protein